MRSTLTSCQLAVLRVIKDLFALSWNVHELGRLNKQGCEILIEGMCLVELLSNPATKVVAKSIPVKISQLQERLTSFISGVTRHRRRGYQHFGHNDQPKPKNLEPYTLPISCLPYHSLNTTQTRAHITNVVTKMQKRNMKVAGKYQLCLHVHYAKMFRMVLVWCVWDNNMFHGRFETSYGRSPYINCS